MIETQKLGMGARMVLFLVLAGVLAMLGAWLYGRITHPELVVHRPVQEAGSGAMAGMKMDSAVGKLMEQVGKNPNDGNALFHLAQHLGTAGNWAAAESFIERAVVLEPANPEWLHFLGVTKHGLEKNDEAAAALERVASMTNKPDVRYSLGVLYLYYLQQPEKGKEQLQKALSSPELPADLKKMISDELDKISKVKP